MITAVMNYANLRIGNYPIEWTANSTVNTIQYTKVRNTNAAVGCPGYL